MVFVVFPDGRWERLIFREPCATLAYWHDCLLEAQRTAGSQEWWQYVLVQPD